MTEFEVLHVINIFSIWGLVLYLLKIIGQAKYTLWVCIIRGILFNDKRPWEWMVSHRKYLICYILVPLLAWLSLTLTSQLNVGLPQIRTIWTVATSIFVWIFIIILIHIINKIDNDNGE